MSWEGFKNILLITLIAISGLLTWSLWFYQPNYQEADEHYVKEADIQKRVDPIEIIKPTKMFYHKNGEYYGTTSDTLITNATRSIQKWKLYNFQNRSLRYATKRDLENLAGKTGNVELVFNDTVSLPYYKHFLRIDEKDIPSAKFNRIIVKTDEENRHNSSVYFISDRSSFSVVEANVDMDFVKDFKKDYTDLNKYTRYEKLNITDKHSILAPANKTVVDLWYYKLENLSVDNFKQALFTKPNNVKQEGDIYTDGISILSKNVQSRTISFKNRAVGVKETRVTEEEIVQESVDYVNNHAGWNYNYRYADLNGKTATFRLYMDGLPLFNTMGASEIAIRWGTGIVQAYDRPYVSPLNYIKEDKEEMPSGKDALEAFKLYMGNQYDPKKLEDMAIGYDYDPSSDKDKGLGLYLLSPNWFYLYDGVWTKITLTDRGNEDGLE